jgi:predicted tellurium resistance membrane protein TerC
MMELFTTENMLALGTLTFMEIVLGIDNIVFLVILAGKLPPEQQKRARQVGLFLAMFMRIALLFSLAWIMGLTKPLFSIPLLGEEFSGRDLVLFFGGLFLIGKATLEIHDKVEKTDKQEQEQAASTRFWSVIIQIVLLDIVFSLDSVITAVGMAQNLTIMVIAVVAAVGVMMLAAASISRFIDENPTLKILALAFLVLIGIMLVIESFGKHVEKGYIYFAIGFSLAVELLNLRTRKRPAKEGE